MVVAPRSRALPRRPHLAEDAAFRRLSAPRRRCRTAAIQNPVVSHSELLGRSLAHTLSHDVQVVPRCVLGRRRDRSCTSWPFRQRRPRRLERHRTSFCESGRVPTAPPRHDAPACSEDHGHVRHPFQPGTRLYEPRLSRLAGAPWPSLGARHVPNPFRRMATGVQVRSGAHRGRRLVTGRRTGCGRGAVRRQLATTLNGAGVSMRQPATFAAIRRGPTLRQGVSAGQY